MELKSDLFGTVCRVERRVGSDVSLLVERDARRSRWWLRALAYRLARREAQALQALHAVPGVPTFHDFSAGVLRRGWIEDFPCSLHARATCASLVLPSGCCGACTARA